MPDIPFKMPDPVLVLPDKRGVWVYLIPFGGGAACLGVGAVDCSLMDAVWDYPNIEMALDVARLWDGVGDPSGGPSNKSGLGRVKSES